MHLATPTLCQRRCLTAFCIGMVFGWHSVSVGQEADLRKAAMPESAAPGYASAADREGFDKLAADQLWDDPAVVKAANLQPQPPLLPPQEFQPEIPLPSAAREAWPDLFGVGTFGQAVLGWPSWRGAGRLSTDLILGVEALPRVTSDAGSLLGKSPSALGVEVQRRTPIVNDPRVRGSRVGQLAASGSYWVPARLDLDTILNKLDSRIISQINVIKGPYSVLYGPGFDFVDVQLLRAPRYQRGFQSHGSTSFDYKTNGEQWYGRQSVWGGNKDYGFRFGYGHATGNDYTTGEGTGIPSSYRSRDIDLALGMDLTADSSLEFSLLRLDQTDVEFPGQAFDMDFLVTDGYELTYLSENHRYFDLLTLETWYNQTRFAGDSQAPGKRRLNPILDEFEFLGLTDAHQMSTGYSAAITWGEPGGQQLTIGSDLRVVKQRVDEFNRFRARGLDPTKDPLTDPPLEVFPLFYAEVEKMVPRSSASNPGLFVQHALPVGDRLVLKSGGRFDWVWANVEDPRTVQLFDAGAVSVVEDWAKPGMPEPVMPVVPDGEVSLREFFGDQYFRLGSLYITGEYQLSRDWTALAGCGYAMRPPSLTELYSFNGPFLAILQRGGNFVFGDPQLRPEQLWQADLGLTVNYGRFRAGATAFHAWIQDYVTLRPVIPGVVVPEDKDVILPVQFVNTDLATLWGGEAFASYDWSAWVTVFARLSYVQGDDRTRDRSGGATFPTIYVFYPFVTQITVTPPDEEPLPGIAPLESRLGLHLHPPGENPRWGIELAARVVADQDRVARTLREQNTPGFTTWDLRGYWRATDKLLLVAGVENFTDKHYREHLDLRPVFQPGANFYFGSELSY